MIIDDDFLPKSEVNAVRDLVLSHKFPWSFFQSTTSPQYKTKSDFINDDSVDSHQFVHEFYAKYMPQSEFYEDAARIMGKFLIKHNIPLRAILRGKCNLMTNFSEPGKYLPPHVDFKFDHKVFLYYVNDADGETIIFNERYDSEKPVTLTEKARIDPKAGRAIVFDGSLFHSPGHPFNSKTRAVINIPFL
jgi:hypothetical protein